MSSYEGFNPEKRAIQQESIPLFLEAAYKRAEDISNRDALQERNFIDHYDEGRVNRDLADVANKREMIQKSIEQDSGAKETYFWGKAVEGFVHQQINDNHFFGEYAQGIKTAEFDDLFRGVDEVVAFSQPGRGAGHLGLGIDITFGNPRKKLERIIRDTKAGKLTEVRYFNADIPGWKFRGELQTPHVVVGASRASLKDALIKWNEGQNDELRGNPLQMLFLRQMADQLDALREIAPENTKGHYQVAEQYVQEAISSARSAGIKMGELKEDPVHNAIRTTMEGLIASSKS